MAVLTLQQRRRRPPPRWYLPGLLTLLLSMTAVPLAQAEQQQSRDIHTEKTKEYAVKAAFLYKFCLYVEWPETAFETTDSPLVLGVTGPHSMADNLARVVDSRTVHGRPVQVRYVDTDAALHGLHVVFLSNTIPLSSLPSLAGDGPMLIITENPPQPDAESGINFVLDDNRVRFDVQLDNTSRRGLKLSAQLLQAARNVQGIVP